ncbi:MAG: 8-oxo-dGTP diphosphatase [Alphaproteobacteria bacterium]|nr:8-oxo-dGTP diphosphatase [Alphaproteobacteria bacterium]
MIKHNPCVVCLLEKDDQILMVKNLRGIQKDLYSFPGGKLEEGESLSDCVFCEVKEETNLTLKKATCLGRFDIESVEHVDSPDRFSVGENMHVYVFVSSEFSGELVPAKGEVEAFWVKKDEVPYDKMQENDKAWLPLALKGERFHKSFLRDKQGKLSLVEHDDKDVESLLGLRLRQYEMMKGITGR